MGGGVSADPRYFGGRWFNNATYAAEHEAESKAWRRGGAPHLVPVEAREFTERVIAEQGWEPIEIGFYSGGSGSGRAWDGTGKRPRRVRYSRRGVDAVVVLHELAHVATPGDRGHGEAFRNEYLRLCRIYLPNYARCLAAAFRRRKCSFDDDA